MVNRVFYRISKWLNLIFNLIIKNENILKVYNCLRCLIIINLLQLLHLQKYFKIY